MLTFEITKTNTPLPQKGLAPILILPHTYVCMTKISSVKQNKTKPMLSRRSRPSAPWVLSSTGKLIRYLHGSYLLPYCNTVSTSDTSSAVRQNTVELIIISDAVYIGCRSVTRQIPENKLLPRFIYDILTQMSNYFQWSLVRCRHGASILLFRRRFPL